MRNSSNMVGIQVRQVLTEISQFLPSGSAAAVRWGPDVNDDEIPAVPVQVSTQVRSRLDRIRDMLDPGAHMLFRWGRVPVDGGLESSPIAGQEIVA